MTAYVDLVCAEIRATKRLGQQSLQTVSFGGGVSDFGVAAQPLCSSLYAHACLKAAAAVGSCQSGCHADPAAGFFQAAWLLLGLSGELLPAVTVDSLQAAAQ
jgi:hypothetical protein